MPSRGMVRGQSPLSHALTYTQLGLNHLTVILQVSQ
jgi:hypothetical protein